ncbi:MAG: PhnD/SsuA/transferrin family substrate-binding protein [Bdellovibrionota bacterium]
MTFRRFFFSLPFLVQIIWQCFFVPTAVQAEQPAPPVKIAVVAFPDQRLSLHRQREELAIQQLSSEAHQQLLIAPGTAGDVIAWAERGDVDAAIVPAGVFAEILARQSEMSKTRWKHVATSISDLPGSPETRGGTPVCVVDRRSSLQTLEDFAALTSARGANFFFPSPLSAVGRIAPQLLLEQAGVEVAPNRTFFLGSHEAALLALRNQKEGAAAIACTSADVLAGSPAASQLRTIPFQTSTIPHVPGEIVIAREPLVSEGLSQLFSHETSAFVPARDQSVTEQAAAWRPLLARSGLHRSIQDVTLDEVGETLLQYRRTHTDPLRLAVVFSGGGAKCSFQVGVLRAIEEKLAEMREQLNDDSFDIGLVVGTSGGALNALPTAIGISRSSDGWKDLAETWQQLDQRQLIRPSWSVRLDMVLWFACIQGALLLRYRKHRHFSNPSKYPWIISKLFIPLGIIEVVVARLPYKPWSLLGKSGTVHHIWLWLTWGLEGSGWTLIALGVGAVLLRRSRRIKHAPFVLRFRIMPRIFWVGILGLPVVQAWTILFYQSNLSDSDGIQNALISGFRELVDHELVRRGEAPLAADKTDHSRKALEAMSREVVERKVLKRDLVLTASALPQSPTALGGDLYFYLPASSERPRAVGAEPSFDARGVPLERRPRLLFDAVLASGAIYPVFPSRTMEDFPERGDRMELVDGSFDHRSPIEAAVLWGATHIIQIQAVTDEISQRGTFIANINAALNHLYDQAQLLDTRSKEQVLTFTVAPQPPHIGLLDFSDNLIAHSITKGYREGGGKGTETSNYHKELTKPQFVDFRSLDSLL